MTKAQNTFRIETATLAIFIQQQSLMPTHFFTSEDKESIAAIHAEHIQQYYNQGFQPATQIALNAGNRFPNLPGNLLTKTSTFETESGQKIDVQTIFSPFKGQLSSEKSPTLKHLTLKNNEYV